MNKSQSAKEILNIAGSDDVRRLFPHLDDHAVAAVLALKPTVAQLEEAATRNAGGSDIFADIRPERGVVEAIMDLLRQEEDELNDR